MKTFKQLNITNLKVKLTCDHNCSKCPDWWWCISLSDKAR